MSRALRPRLEQLPLWPGLVLGAFGAAAIAVGNRLLATQVPRYLTTLDDAHDIDLYPQEEA